MIKLKSLLTEEIYDVYRGDDVPFDKFNFLKIGSGIGGSDNVGFWFTNNQDAAEFYGEHVRKFSIHLSNPMVVSSDMFVKHYPNGPTYWAKLAFQNGHDGVIIKDIVDGDVESTVFCVFDDSQIDFI